MKTVLAFNPDAVVLGADPPQLDCCDLLSEIKGSRHTQNLRVVMLSLGGFAERTRGLELGADHVPSLPFDPHGLLSRVRSQLRNKYIADEFRGRLRIVGSGPAGQKGAINAAKLGKRVAVVERDGMIGGASHHGSQDTWSVQNPIIEFNRFMISSHEQNEEGSAASSLLSTSDVQVLEEWRS
jgi:DNA-binding response OmpR family regulator